VKIDHVYEQEELVSATEFRQALASGDPIKKFIPDHVEEEEVIKLFT